MKPNKLTKLLSESGIQFNLWNDWDQVQREIARLRVARDKAEATYCLFLHAVETMSADWRAGMDSKEPQTFEHWLRKNKLHDDPARYRAMLTAIEMESKEVVEKIGATAVATALKNLPEDLHKEAISILKNKRADAGQPLPPRVGQSTVATIRSRHPEVCPVRPRVKVSEKLKAKTQQAKAQAKTLADENRELKARVSELEKEIVVKDKLIAELRERLGAVKNVVGARNRKRAGESQIALPAE